MTRIVGLCGSLRKASFNGYLLQAAVPLMPAGAALAAASIRGIPLYDGDREEEEGIPDAVDALKNEVAAADGLLLFTPEYNNSLPGAFKNAIDWMSRPSSDIGRVFGDKPVGVVGATPGGFGTTLAQTAWLPVLRHLGTRPWFGGRLMVARAKDAFDDQGHLTSEPLRDQLTRFLEGFTAFVRLESERQER